MGEILGKLAEKHETDVAICNFRDGEIVTQEVLEAAMGEVPEIQEESSEEFEGLKFEELKEDEEFKFDVQRSNVSSVR